MIRKETVEDVIVIGEDTSKHAKISSKKTAKLEYLLTEGLYKDPITAVIAEWTNNGIDAVVQAGKNPIDYPVIVSIEKNSMGSWGLTVEDKGIGLDNDDFENICMNYLESTKEEDDDTLGHFGIGMKSFMSLKRPATFTCRKNGIERKYLAYKGDTFLKYDLIHEISTEEENGVKCELGIKDWSEYQQFVNKARTKLCYYDTAVLIIDGNPQEFEIFRNELFQYTKNIIHSQLHIAYKDVYYAIDWDALGISQINFPVAIRIGLSDEFMPTPSRESYISSENTKKLLLDKISQLADWFIAKYNETVKEVDNFLEAYSYIDKTDKVVRLGDKEFTINPLLSRGHTPVEEIKMKGVTIHNLSFYKSKLSHLLWEYDIVAANIHNMYKTVKIRENLVSNIVYAHGHKVVLVDGTPIGNTREYLKEKHGNNTLFISKVHTRILNNVTGTIGFSGESYSYILQLKYNQKDKWRSIIQEFNYVRDSIIGTFIDNRGVEKSPEFLKWIEDKKYKQKLQREENRAKGIYTGINKQQGDVTLAYDAPTKYTGEAFFKKAAYPIADLTKNHYLTVLFFEEEKEQVAGIATAFLKNDKIRFAMVGKKEINKVPEHFQFIKFKDFMEKATPFRRLASAILFGRVVKDYETISSRHSYIFAECLSHLSKDMRELSSYVTANYSTKVNATIEESILQIAEEQNLFDKQLWDVYIRVKDEVKKYDFITLLEPLSYYRKEDREKQFKLINQMLLFRKKYYQDLPESIQLIVKDKEITSNQVN
jgi:hypothetical protein